MHSLRVSSGGCGGEDHGNSSAGLAGRAFLSSSVSSCQNQHGPPCWGPAPRVPSFVMSEGSEQVSRAPSCQSPDKPCRCRCGFSVTQAGVHIFAPDGLPPPQPLKLLKSRHAKFQPKQGGKIPLRFRWQRGMHSEAVGCPDSGSCTMGGPAPCTESQWEERAVGSSFLGIQGCGLTV